MRVTNRELRSRIRRLLNENDSFSLSGLKNNATVPSTGYHPKIYNYYFEFDDGKVNPMINQLANLFVGEGGPGLTGEIGENLLELLINRNILECTGGSVNTNAWTGVSYAPNADGFGISVSRDSGGGSGDSYAIDIWCGKDPAQQIYNDSMKNINIDGLGISQKFSASTAAGSKNKQRAKLSKKSEVINSVGYAFSRMLNNQTPQESIVDTFNSNNATNQLPIPPRLDMTSSGNLSNRQIIEGSTTGTKISGVLDFAYSALKIAFVNYNKNQTPVPDPADTTKTLSNRQPVTVSAKFMAYNLAVLPVNFDDISIQSDAGKLGTGAHFDQTIRQVTDFLKGLVLGMQYTDNSGNSNIHVPPTGTSIDDKNSLLNSYEALPINYFDQNNWKSGARKLGFYRSANVSDLDVKTGFKEYVNNIIDQYYQKVDAFNPNIYLIGDASIKQQFTVTVKDILMLEEKETMIIEVSGDGRIGEASQYTIQHTLINLGKSRSDARTIPMIKILTQAATTDAPSRFVAREDGVVKAIQTIAQSNSTNIKASISNVARLGAVGATAQASQLAVASQATENSMARAKAQITGVDNIVNLLGTLVLKIVETQNSGEYGQEVTNAYLDLTQFVELGVVAFSSPSTISFSEVLEDFIEELYNASTSASAGPGSPTGITSVKINPIPKQEIVNHLRIIKSYINAPEMSILNLTGQNSKINSFIDQLTGDVAPGAASLLPESRKFFLNERANISPEAMIAEIEKRLMPTFRALFYLQKISEELHNIVRLVPDVATSVLSFDIAIANALLDVGKIISGNKQQSAEILQFPSDERQTVRTKQSKIAAEARIYENILKKILYTAKKRR